VSNPCPGAGARIDRIAGHGIRELLTLCSVAELDDIQRLSLHLVFDPPPIRIDRIPVQMIIM